MPTTEAVAVPFDRPHVSLVDEAVAVGRGLLLIITEVEEEQPAALVTVTE